MMSDLQLKAWHIENLIEHEPDAQVVILSEAQAELERLRAQVAELTKSINLPDEITAKPSDSYDGLLKQFSALKNLANGKCRMASHWMRQVENMNMQIALSNSEMVNAERETNAALTDALLDAEKANAELVQERDRLRQKILGHNQTCVNSCAFDCSEDMSGSCVDCPQSWMIKTDWAEEA